MTFKNLPQSLIDAVSDIMKGKQAKVSKEEEETETVDKAAKMQAHGGDPQLAEYNSVTSDEPNSAVGQTGQKPKVKHVDVVKETTNIAGVKTEVFRLLMQYPNGRHEFFPPKDRPGARGLDELRILCLTLDSFDSERCSEAIDNAKDLPSEQPQFNGPSQGIGEEKE